MFPKRCGHLDGKSLVPTQSMEEKVHRAAWARDAGDPGFIICARYPEEFAWTDSLLPSWSPSCVRVFAREAGRYPRMFSGTWGYMSYTDVLTTPT